MRRLLILLFAVASAFSATVDSVRTHLNSGNPAKLIDVVMIGDGYTAAEQDSFIAQARMLFFNMLAYSPFTEHRKLFNMHTVLAVSAESGVNKPDSGITVNNRFGTYLFGAGIMPSNTSLVRQYAAKAPGADLIIVVGNVNNANGACGGSIIGIGKKNTAPLTLAHEVGHYFGLGDEYLAWIGGGTGHDSVYRGGEPSGVPNVTTITDSARVKWKHWFTPGVAIPTPAGRPLNTVGLFEGGYTYRYGIYRPTERCRMNDPSSPFCPVCMEWMTLDFFRHVNILDTAWPAPALSAAAVRDTLRVGRRDTLRFFAKSYVPPQYRGLRWTLDGSPLSAGNETLAVTYSLAPERSALVSLRIADTTLLVRKDTAGLLFKNYYWVIRGDSLKPDQVESSPMPSAGLRLSVSPNPAMGRVQVRWEARGEAPPSRLSILDVSGRMISGPTLIRGTSFTWSAKGCPAGLYFVILKTQNKTLRRPFVLSL